MTNEIIFLLVLIIFLGVITFLKVSEWVIHHFIKKQGGKLIEVSFIGLYKSGNNPDSSFISSLDKLTNKMTYKVWYLDEEMNKHEAKVQISLQFHIGIYFIEDKITQYANKLNLPPKG